MIYLDMDGVLADFNRHTRELKIPYNYQWYDPKETWTKETWEGERIKTELMHGPGFWDKIPPMPDAYELFDYCRHYDPFILTAKPQPDSPQIVADDKYKWVLEHLDSDFPIEKMIVVRKADKPLSIGRTGHRYQILVDDDHRSIDIWNAGKCPDHGQKAIGVHHVSARQSINKIEEILNAPN